MEHLLFLTNEEDFWIWTFGNYLRWNKLRNFEYAVSSFVDGRTALSDFLVVQNKDNENS